MLAAHAAILLKSVPPSPLLDCLLTAHPAANTFHFSVDVFDLETTGQWRLYASTSKEPYPFIAKAWGEQIGTVSTRLIRRFDFETGVWKTHNNHHNHLVQDLLTAQISKFRDYFMGMGVTTTVTLELQYASKDFCSAQANPAISRLNHFSRRALEYLPLWEKRGAVLAEPAASTPLMNEINAQRGQFIVTLPIGDAGVARRVVGQAMRHEARRLKESQSEGRLSLREYSTLTVELQKCRRQLERLVHDIVIL